VVRAAVDAVHHRIDRAIQFVVEAAFDQPADDWSAMRLAGEDIVRRAACDALLVESAVHPLDDVVALAEFA